MIPQENNPKLERLLKMTEHPELFTDDELREILADDELRSYYELMVDAKEAFTVPKNKVRKHYRIAVIFLGLLLISTLSFAAYQVYSRYVARDARSENSKVTIDSANDDSLSPITPHSSPQQEALPEPIHKTFENTELEQMLTEMAAYYQVRVRFLNDEPRHLRLYYEWNSNDNLADIVRTLDQFEHVSITLADETISVR